MINPLTAKVAFVISLSSAIGLSAYYIGVLIFIYSTGLGMNGLMFVYPIGAGYLFFGYVGSLLIMRKNSAKLGGSVILVGYITMAVLTAYFTFLYILSFEWYIIIVLVFILLGIFGGSLVMGSRAPSRD
ncbi:MAG: hypothetical protein ACFFCS_00335 [Candidatus Hodarchaeota archaeon]